MKNNVTQKVSLDHIVKPGLDPGDNPYHFLVVQVDGDRIRLEVTGVDWGRGFQPYRSKTRPSCKTQIASDLRLRCSSDVVTNLFVAAARHAGLFSVDRSNVLIPIPPRSLRLGGSAVSRFQGYLTVETPRRKGIAEKTLKLRHLLEGLAISA